MGFRIQAEFKGLAPLVKQLDGMKKGLRNKTLRSAMRKSASVVNKQAKTNVTAQGIGYTGQLKKSLGVKVKVYPSGVVIGVVEPRAGFRIAIRGRSRAGLKAIRFHDPRKIAHLVEGGTVVRTNKAGANRGLMRARPFLLPALAMSEGRIEEIFAEEIDKALAAK